MMEPWKRLMLICLVPVDPYSKCHFFQTFHFLSDPPEKKTIPQPSKGPGMFERRLALLNPQGMIPHLEGWCVWQWELTCWYLRDLFVQHVKIGKLFFDAKSMPLMTAYVGRWDFNCNSLMVKGMQIPKLIWTFRVANYWSWPKLSICWCV